MTEETCPNCGNEWYRHVEEGDYTVVDTIGSQLLCVTDDGLYMHGYKQYDMGEYKYS
jgi:hypothetical protein